MELQHPLQKSFATSDFWLAGALLASGKKLVSLDWRGSRAFFIFGDPTNCESLAHAHWAGDLGITSLAFADALRRLKDQLRFRERQNEVS